MYSTCVCFATRENFREKIDTSWTNALGVDSPNFVSHCKDLLRLFWRHFFREFPKLFLRHFFNKSLGRQKLVPHAHFLLNFDKHFSFDVNFLYVNLDRQMFCHLIITQSINLQYDITIRQKFKWEGLMCQ